MQFAGLFSQGGPSGCGAWKVSCVKAMILPVTQAGNPILAQPARSLEIHEILRQPVQDLIASRRKTLHDTGGVGLSAPQVGEPGSIGGD